MNTIQNYVSAGAKLMAESLRDEASIVDITTFWNFMKVVEGFSKLFTHADRYDQIWHEHVRCYENIMVTSNDIVPVEGEMVALGSTFVSAMTAYSEQSADFLVFIVGRRDRETVEPMLQDFDTIMLRLINEIQAVSHSMVLDTVLQEYRRCRREIY